MATAKAGYVNNDYRQWEQTAVDVGRAKVQVCTKPGVFAHGAIDRASVLLAQHVIAAPGDTVVQMNGGNALAAAVLVMNARAHRVIITDRNALAIEASQRTLSANGASAADVFPGHGSIPLPGDVCADSAAIRIPHDKLSLRQLLNDAFVILESGGACYIAGATNEGIKSAARILEDMFGNAATVATEGGHRIVRAIKRGSTPSISDSAFLSHDAFHEQTLTVRGVASTFASRPGVFSWEHLDEATSMLADHMDLRSADRVLDLGCGSGVLGITAARVCENITMLDVDFEAVRSAKRSVQLAGLHNVRVLASDVASAVLNEQFDLVITNPPFHVGKATDLSVPVQFIHDAWTVLAPGGRLNLVANRTLPYERAIRFLFGNITTLHDGTRFKVLAATKQS